MLLVHLNYGLDFFKKRGRSARVWCAKQPVSVSNAQSGVCCPFVHININKLYNIRQPNTLAKTKDIYEPYQYGNVSGTIVTTASDNHLFSN